MIRFSCPHCDKAFRVDDSRAGLSTKCPGCQNKITVPHPEVSLEEDFDEVEVLDDEETPAVSRKKKSGKRRRSESEELEARRGLRMLIIFSCILLGSQMFNMVRTWKNMSSSELKKKPAAATNPVPDDMRREVTAMFAQKEDNMDVSKLLENPNLSPKEKRMIKEASEMSKRNREMLREQDAQFQRQFFNNTKNVPKNPKQEELATAMNISYIAFTFTASLITCIFFKMNWARYLLAGLLLLSVVLTLLLAIFILANNFDALQAEGTGILLLRILITLIGITLPTAIGIVLLKSQRISAYMDKRR